MLGTKHHVSSTAAPFQCFSVHPGLSGHRCCGCFTQSALGVVDFGERMARLGSCTRLYRAVYDIYIYIIFKIHNAYMIMITIRILYIYMIWYYYYYHRVRYERQKVRSCAVVVYCRLNPTLGYAEMIWHDSQLNTIRGVCYLMTLLKLTWRTIFCNLRYSTKIASDSLTPCPKWINIACNPDGISPYINPYIRRLSANGLWNWNQNQHLGDMIRTFLLVAYLYESLQK